MTGIMNAPVGYIEVLSLQIEIRQFLNTYKLKGIYNRLAKGAMPKSHLFQWYHKLSLYNRSVGRL